MISCYLIPSTFCVIIKVRLDILNKLVEVQVLVKGIKFYYIRKTSARGHKGQLSRSGGSAHPRFEGGQTPITKRLPKYGRVFKAYLYK